MISLDWLFAIFNEVLRQRPMKGTGGYSLMLSLMNIVKYGRFDKSSLQKHYKNMVNHRTPLAESNVLHPS